MEFVEINANRQPRLSGGRRGASTLQPGGNAVSNNLVPASKLPASAGSLDAVFSNLNKNINSTAALENIGKEMKGKGRGRPKKTGGATLKEILHHPSQHQAQFDAILKGAKKGGAMVMNPDGTATGVGSDDMTWRRIGRGRPKKSNVASGLFHHTIIPEGGKMSKLVPRHGHGATTSIGTNYQLGQFGGSMTQPIGNTASTLSPALSGMSVGGKRYTTGLAKLTPEQMKEIIKKSMTGAGRKPKGKNLMKLLKYMVATKKKLHGMGKMSGGDLLGDAWESIKKIGLDLYKEYGPQIFDSGKDLLLDELKKHAHNYITGGMMDGGSFWGDVWDGIKAVASGIWNALKLILNDDVVKEVERELLHQSVEMASQYAQQQMTSGAPAPSGAGRPGHDGHGIRHIGGLRPGQFNLYRGKKGGAAWLNPDGTPGYSGSDDPNFLNGIMPITSPTNILDNPELQKIIRKYKGGALEKNPRYKGDFSTTIPIGEFGKSIPSNAFGAGRPGANGHGVRKIGGNRQQISSAAHKLYKDYISTAPEDKNFNTFSADLNYYNSALQGGKKPSARGAIVKKIMKEKNLSLPMASKYVKEHGLY